jgi:DHA2 family multidrug resistance protein-like MFS transporter
MVFPAGRRSGIVAGLGIGAIFLRRQMKLADPMIDLSLFRSPAFNAALGTYALGTFVLFGAFIFVGQYMQLVLGMTPLVAGLWTILFAAGFIVGSMLTPKIARRIGPAHLIAGGLTLAGVGFATLAQVDGTSNPFLLAAAFVIYSLGLAPVFTLATDLIVGSAPPEQAGVAAAISETSSEFGGALGIAILGSIGTAVYRSAMAGSVSQNVPSHVAHAAMSTLGAAVEASERLGAPFGSALLDSARNAFVAGMHAAAWVAAAAMLATAIVAARALGAEKRNDSGMPY